MYGWRKARLSLLKVMAAAMAVAIGGKLGFISAGELKWRGGESLAKMRSESAGTKLQCA